MRALSLLQPWASLILCGAKPYEFRSWPLWAGAGERYAIHASAKAPSPRDLDEIAARLRRGVTDGMDATQALALLAAARRDPALLPRGAVLGSVLGGRPVPAHTLFTGADPGIWANPVSAPRVLETPIPAKGKQGWWFWEGDA